MSNFPGIGISSNSNVESKLRWTYVFGYCSQDVPMYDVFFNPFTSCKAIEPLRRRCYCDQCSLGSK